MVRKMYRSVHTVQAERWENPSQPPPGVCQRLDAPAQMLVSGSPPTAKPHVHTRQGAIAINPGDWIATATTGDTWPMANDEFNAMYREIPGAPTA